MGTRTIVRTVMVGLAIVVMIAVAMLWQGRPDDVVATRDGGAEFDGGAVSRTLDATYISDVNGIRSWEVHAGRVTTFEGNRVIYDQGVELKLHSTPETEGGVSEVTNIRAERLEVVERPVPIEGDPLESLQLFDNVVAVLPQGEEFSSDMLRYRDGKLTTNRGVRMRAGSIVIESRTLNYDLETGSARLGGVHEATLRPLMRGPVRVWSEDGGDEGGMALDLQGSANVLVYEVKLGRLQLLQGPQIRLSEAFISGGEIILGLEQAAGSVQVIEARRGARAVWWPGDADEEYVVTGEIIGVGLDGGQPRGLAVRSETEGVARPHVELGGADVHSDIVEVGFGNAEEASVVARGSTRFFPRAAGGIEEIRADELALGAGGPEDLVADGNVDIEVVRESGGAVRFTGPRLSISYRDDAIAAAAWPLGMSYRDAESGTTVTAGHGELEPSSGDWLLRGQPPGAAEAGAQPQLRSADFDVTADEIRMGSVGSVDLTGAVSAQLRGETIRTVGPLFGDAAQVEAAAEELSVGVGGRRLAFIGNARVWQAAGDQLLRADEIALLPDLNELHAKDNVFVSLINPPDPENGREEARTITLTSRSLLVEGAPLHLIASGEALLVLEGEGRTIGGDRLAVELTADGRWNKLEVHDRVVMTDPAGTGEGARLEYDADTGVVVIYASDTVQATFVPDTGLDIRDREGLRLEWEGDAVKVTAMQNGTTQIVRGGQR